MEQWLGKPYFSLDAYCKNNFHCKCHKVALNAQMTCPNRDGSIGTQGCIFCSAGGSGDFAIPISNSSDLHDKLSDRTQGEPNLIAYFQAYTNTYAPLPYLEEVYTKALEEPTVRGISIATRPDCLPDEVLSLLVALKAAFPQKFIWIELGLQTIHEKTAEFIRRGYALSCFEKAFHSLRELEIPVIVHLILGLPGETRDMMLQSVDYLNQMHPFGLKLQLLHILRGTDLADHYLTNPFPVMERDEYLSLIMDCLGRLSPDIVIHRLTGDGPRKDLIAPLWSTDKKNILNLLHKRMKELGRTQGDSVQDLTQGI